MLDVKALNMALENLEHEKKVSREKIIEAVEKSLAAAYQKEYGKRGQVTRCHINFETGETSFEQIKVVVDETIVRMSTDEDEEIETKENEKTAEDEETLLPKYNEEKHILLSTAKLLRKNVELGDEISFSLENKNDFGRIAAQTAKQVIIQKIREAENESVALEFEEKEGTIVSGIVQRIERGNVYVDLGRTTAIMPFEEKMRTDRFHPGQRVKAYLYSIEENPRGLHIRVSRTHPKFLVELFKGESSEIADGIIEIVSIAREPGSRSKVAVVSNDQRVDPIGACVGQRGMRINAIMSELNGEKIDIIEWGEDIKSNIAASISPAKATDIEINEEEKKAILTVSEEEQSLAIGRGGQNVRLAAKLTGWKMDILGQRGILVEGEGEGIVDGETLKENPLAEAKTLDEEITEELKNEEAEVKEELKDLEIK